MTEADRGTSLTPGAVAIVTGAASGIGRASALAFAGRGVRVALVDVNGAGLEETARLIAEGGGDALVVETDLTNPAEVEQIVPLVTGRWGRLDYAHNNAGLSGIYKPITDFDEDSFNRILQVNLFGVWRCLKHEMAYMTQHGGGSIVNTSSILGSVGMANNSAYTAAKHAVNGLTRSAAIEGGAAGIRVNAVAPGPTQTGMISSARNALLPRMPAGRVAGPHEIAEVAVWLCSPAASFVTGAVIPADGGYLAS